MATSTLNLFELFCKLFMVLACLGSSNSVQITRIEFNGSSADNASLHRVNEVGHVLDSLLVNYDKRVRPDVGGPPVLVTVHMHILAIVPINEINMDFTATFFFRQYWRDHRLAFGKYLQAPSIKPSAPFADQIWLPDTFFDADMSDHKTRHDFLLEITSDGNITYSTRKRVNSYCFMNLRHFPMDEQNCELSFKSYAYNDKDIVYAWRTSGDTHVTLSQRLAIPQYTLVEWKELSWNDTYITGNFPSLGVSFRLRRHIGFYIIQNFIPTALIVVLSWVGFWINEHSVPARVSLGITTVLAITTLFFGVQASLPKVGYIKAIDFFLLGSFFFVFGALVEFAIICTVTDLREGNSRDTPRDDSSRDSSTIHASGFSKPLKVYDEPEDSFKSFSQSSLCLPFRGSKVADKKKSDDKNCKQSSRGRSLPHPIDRASRILFPLAFFLFVLIYCVTFVFL
ncbi:hypothetical protein ACROYT_G026930 [Oculina patagonica]